MNTDHFLKQKETNIIGYTWYFHEHSVAKQCQGNGGMSHGMACILHPCKLHGTWVQNVLKLVYCKYLEKVLGHNNVLPTPHNVAIPHILSGHMTF